MLISQILWMFKQFLVFAILGLSALTLLFSIIYFFIYKKLLKGKKRICFKSATIIVIFVGYILMVLYATWFSRSPSGYSSVNLNLFSSYVEAWNNCTLRSWQLLILNIVMFVPFGILLPLVNNKFRKIIYSGIVGAFFTLSIELIQFIFNIGVFELDDLLNNFVGVIIGYGIVMAFLSIVNREKIVVKKSICYLLPLILVILAFAGISMKYHTNELGNLALSYSYKLDCEDVKITCNTINLEKKAKQDIIYKTKIYDKKTALEYAKKTFKDFGIPTEDVEVIQYNDNAIYKVFNNEVEYSLWIEYIGGKYTYTDFSFDKFKPENKNLTEESATKALEKMKIVLPEGVKFIKDEGSEDGQFYFEADMIKGKDKYFTGQLSGTLYEDGNIRELNNNIITLEKYRDVDIISEAEAFDKIKQGRFKLYMEEPLSTIEIQSIEIIHRTDSKGYYQPVYKFDVKVNGIKRYIYIPAIA